MVNNFIRKFSKENNKNITTVDTKAKNALYSYDWPGNIRELRNCIEGAVVIAEGSTLRLEDLPPAVRKSQENSSISIPAGTDMDTAEKIIIRETLLFCHGNKSKTAQVLGIGRKTLHRKLMEMNLVSGDPEEEEVET